MNFSSLVNAAKLLVKPTQCIDMLLGGRRYKRKNFHARYKFRRTMPPMWRPQQYRVLHPENVTQKNQSLIKESVEEMYSPVKVEPFEMKERTPYSIRTGLITRKLGVHIMWTKRGERVNATLLQVLDNHVIKYLTPEKVNERNPKYNKLRPRYPMGRLIVGADAGDPRLFSKEFCNVFKQAGVMPKKVLRKFSITPDAAIAPGTPLTVHHFKPGQHVDCSGITVDRGFQGPMKRWQFHGLPATHGVTKSHRAPGSIGSGKNRVLRGKKMAGHMGRMPRTLYSQRVLRINYHYGVIYVQGHAIPGENGSYVYVQDTRNYRKGFTPETIPYFPTYFPQDDDKWPSDGYAPHMHRMDEPSIVVEELEMGKKKK